MLPPGLTFFWKTLKPKVSMNIPSGNKRASSNEEFYQTYFFQRNFFDMAQSVTVVM